MDKLFFVIFFGLQSAASLRYKVLFEDSRIFSPCRKHPDKFITNFLDMTNSNHTLMADGKIYFSGNMTILKGDSNTFPMQLSMQLFKKSRGTWINTVLNVHRLNFCKSLYDPNEIWYEAVSHIKYDEPLCPFRRGFVVTVDTLTDVIVNIPGKNHEGDYRIDIIIRYGLGMDDFFCSLGYWQLLAA